MQRLLDYIDAKVVELGEYNNTIKSRATGKWTSGSGQFEDALIKTFRDAETDNSAHDEKPAWTVYPLTIRNQKTTYVVRVWEVWCTVQFDSVESACSWHSHLDEAEKIWAAQVGKSKKSDYTPLKVRGA
jgi:hypothetical protein